MLSPQRPTVDVGSVTASHKGWPRTVRIDEAPAVARIDTAIAAEHEDAAAVHPGDAPKNKVAYKSPAAAWSSATYKATQVLGTIDAIADMVARRSGAASVAKKYDRATKTPHHHDSRRRRGALLRGDSAHQGRTRLASLARRNTGAVAGGERSDLGGATGRRGGRDSSAAPAAAAVAAQHLDLAADGTADSDGSDDDDGSGSSAAAASVVDEHRASLSPKARGKTLPATYRDTTSKAPEDRHTAELRLIADWFRLTHEDIYERLGLNQEQREFALTELCKHFELMMVKPEQIVIRQGDVGRFFYIIVAGSCDVYFHAKDDDYNADYDTTGFITPKAGDPRSMGNIDGSERSSLGRFVKKLGPGDCFGELGLRDSLARRTASIISNGTTLPTLRGRGEREMADTEILALSRDVYVQYIQDKYDDGKRLTRCLSFLKRTAPLRAWDDANLTVMAYSLVERVVQAGDVIMREGDPVEYVYFVENGRVVVSAPPTTTKRRERGRHIYRRLDDLEVEVVTTLGIFGDVDLHMGLETYKYRATATEKSRVLACPVRVYKAHLRGEVETEVASAITGQMLRNLAEIRREWYEQRECLLRHEVEGTQEGYGVPLTVMMQVGVIPCMRCGELDHMTDDRVCHLWDPSVDVDKRSIAPRLVAGAPAPGGKGGRAKPADDDGGGGGDGHRTAKVALLAGGVTEGGQLAAEAYYRRMREARDRRARLGNMADTGVFGDPPDLHSAHEFADADVAAVLDAVGHDWLSPQSPLTEAMASKLRGGGFIGGGALAVDTRHDGGGEQPRRTARAPAPPTGASGDKGKTGLAAREAAAAAARRRQAEHAQKLVSLSKRLFAKLEPKKQRNRRGRGRRASLASIASAEAAEAAEAAATVLVLPVPASEAAVVNAEAALQHDVAKAVRASDSELPADEAEGAATGTSGAPATRDKVSTPPVPLSAAGAMAAAAAAPPPRHHISVALPARAGRRRASLGARSRSRDHRRSNAGARPSKGAPLGAAAMGKLKRASAALFGAEDVVVPTQPARPRLRGSWRASGRTIHGLAPFAGVGPTDSGGGAGAGGLQHDDDGSQAGGGTRDLSQHVQGLADVLSADAPVEGVSG